MNFFITSSREFASFNIKCLTTRVLKTDGEKRLYEGVKIAISTDG